MSSVFPWHASGNSRREQPGRTDRLAIIRLRDGNCTERMLKLIRQFRRIATGHDKTKNIVRRISAIAAARILLFY
ncbi:hypothetical protein ACOJBO_00575 [Rhizobium beringeri]